MGFREVVRVAAYQAKLVPRGPKIVGAMREAPRMQQIESEWRQCVDNSGRIVTSWSSEVDARDVLQR